MVINLLPLTFFVLKPNQPFTQNNPCLTFITSVISNPHLLHGLSRANPTDRYNSSAVYILAAAPSQLPSMGAALLVVAGPPRKVAGAVRETPCVGG